MQNDFPRDEKGNITHVPFWTLISPGTGKDDEVWSDTQMIPYTPSPKPTPDWFAGRNMTPINADTCPTTFIGNDAAQPFLKAYLNK